MTTLERVLEINKNKALSDFVLALKGRVALGTLAEKQEALAILDELRHLVCLAYQLTELPK